MKKLIFALTCFFLAVPCQARTMTVKADGSGDYPTIQDAIDDANDGDEIILQPGTYTGPGNRDIDYKGLAIAVRSTDPNDPNIICTTIIDCNGTEEEPHRGFYFHNSEDANSVLSGFSIKKGYAYNYGGAVYCSGSSPTIQGCIITGNNVYDGSPSCGGGICCKSGSNPKIVSCTISNNTVKGAEGWMIFPVASPGSNGCGGGIYFGSNCSPIIENCIISGNKAIGGKGNDGDCLESYPADGGDGLGGGICTDSILGIIKNCIICDNQASGGEGGENVCGFGFPGFCYGGGIYGSSDIVQSTIAGNQLRTPGNGGGIYHKGSMQVINSIIWGNSHNGISGSDGCTVSYCDVQGGYPGEGNVDVAPRFADSIGADYHLKSQAGRWDLNSCSWVKDDVTSPCIDAGDMASPIGFEPFPNGGIINMGAYGGTSEASKSYIGEPVCETIVAGDINGDCIVNFRDFRLMAYHWVEDGSCAPHLLPPGQATDPNPPDGDMGVRLDTTLTWTPGSGAKLHNVYFGTEQSPPFQCNQTHTIFDPGILELKRTYYWRIDEIGTSATTTGNVWNFTTRDFEPCNDPNIVGCWKFDEDSGFTAHDSSGNNNHGILIENTVSWAPTEGVFAGAVRFDGDGPNDNINSPCRIEIPTVGMKVSTGTVALWANITEPPPADIGERYNDRFFFCCQGSGASDRLYLWMSYYDNWLDVKIGSKVLFNNRHLSANTWHHIVLTWHRGVYSVYVDGHETYTTTYGNLNSLPSIAVIGNNSSHTASFHGLIDEVMILNRRLYAPEILFIYQEGSN